MSRLYLVPAGSLLMVLLLSACDRKDTAPASPAPPVVSAQVTANGDVALSGQGGMPPARQGKGAGTAQQWVGKWLGPEVTYLEIIQQAGSYTVNIRNLDGVRTFPAEILENGLRFQRDGVPEFIRATDGRGTGMKWLADKSNCLGIRPGEGYCRG
jgi:hypothetical protein